MFKKSPNYSASVKTIQQALADLKHLSDTVDGYFGKNTFNAVVRFQAASRLLRDGIVGANTMLALDNSFKNVSPAPRPIKTYYPPRKVNGVLPLYGYSWWLDLIKSSPSSSIDGNIKRRNMGVLSIKKAHGSQMNGDFYAVLISKMPVINGRRATARSLFEFIRKGFMTKDLFMDSSLSSFSPYESRDKAAWNSSPLGSVIVIKIPLKLRPDEDAGIVTSEYSLALMRWRVATVRLPRTRGGNHPVSGIREWGMKIQNGGYIFYTRGADRATGRASSQVYPGQSVIFDGGNRLWLSMQNRVEAFVNKHGGRAERTNPYTTKGSWSKISSFYKL